MFFEKAQSTTAGAVILFLTSGDAFFVGGMAAGAASTLAASSGGGGGGGGGPEALSGVIGTGKNDANKWLQLFASAYPSRIGFAPFPGTLNVRLTNDRRYPIIGHSDTLRVNGSDYGGSRDLLMKPCTLCLPPPPPPPTAQTAAAPIEVKCWIWRTTNGERDDSHLLELLAPIKLRSTYGIRDGDAVTVRVMTPPPPAAPVPVPVANAKRKSITSDDSNTTKRIKFDPPTATDSKAGTSSDGAVIPNVLAGVGRIAIHPMRDSTAISGDYNALQKELTTSGYLLLRGFIDRETVLTARRHIMTELAALNLLRVDDTHTVMDGVCRDKTVSAGLLDRQNIAHHPLVLAVLEHPKLFRLFRELFAASPSAAAAGGSDQKHSTAAVAQAPAPATDDRLHVLTAQYKWLRAVKYGDFTGVHFDRVYMSRGSSRLLSVWCPIGDVPVTHGTIAVVPGSHTDPALAKLRSSYGASEVGRDGTTSGWLTDNPETIDSGGGSSYGLQWASTDFRAGDVCIFGLDLLHMSTTNTTDRYRLSCDMRWQPADEPMDPRLAKYKYIPTPSDAPTATAASAATATAAK